MQKQSNSVVLCITVQVPSNQNRWTFHAFLMSRKYSLAKKNKSKPILFFDIKKSPQGLICLVSSANIYSDTGWCWLKGVNITFVPPGARPGTDLRRGGEVSTGIILTPGKMKTLLRLGIKSRDKYAKFYTQILHPSKYPLSVLWEELYLALWDKDNDGVWESVLF